MLLYKALHIYIIYKVKLPKSIQFCFSTVQYLLSTVQKQQY